MKDSEFYRCECGGEILVIDSTYLKEDDEIYLSMFQYANWTGKLSIKERIRYAWNLLRTGYPFSDEIILHRTQVKELNKHLTELLNEEEKK